MTNEEEKSMNMIRRQGSSVAFCNNTNLKEDGEEFEMIGEQVVGGEKEKRKSMPHKSLAQNGTVEHCQLGINMFDELSHKYYKQLKNELKKCILRSIKLSFEDIAGNNFAKEIINETMVNPTLYPKLYQPLYSQGK